MGRSPCCVKEGLNKGAWTAMEDKILVDHIKTHGEGRWRNLPKKAGLKRCGKSCRLRWMNYLRPDIKRGNITLDEEELIIRLHNLLGNRWSLIAGRLPGRTDNEIKNYWNANLSKRVNQCNDQALTKKLTTSHHKRPQNIPTIDEPNTFTQPIESNVVRTKAVRCTKVFLDDPNPPNPQRPQTLPSNNDITNTSNAMMVQPSSMYSSPPQLDEEHKMPSFDEFMIGEDCFMEDLNLVSDLLNSDYSSLCDLSNNESTSNDVSDHLLSPDSPVQQPFVLSQELLEDWLGDEQVM